MSASKRTKEDEVEYLPCTERINVMDYFKEYSLILQEEKNIMSKCDNGTGIPLTERELTELQEACDPSNLTVSDEVVPTGRIKEIKDSMRWPVNYKIPRYLDVNLETLKCKERYNNYGSHTETFTVSTRTIKTEYDDLTMLREVVVIVKVHIPTPYTGNKTYVFKASHNIAILADQTLADLRDKLICTSDIGFMRELETPVETRTPLAKENYPSGFIFIEDCFYNDMRHKNAIDYSEVIRKWSEERGHQKYRTAKMEETRISDLQIRFGYPYVYQHQGICEHVLTFCDVRLLNDIDKLTLASYPYTCFHNYFQSKLCYTCGKSVARFHVQDCDRLPHKYTFFCEPCLTSYCYIDGKKIGTFKLYPYYDKSSILLNL